MAAFDNPPYTPTKDPKNALLWPETRAVRDHFVLVKEIFAGREGAGFSATSPHRNYVRKFRVTCKPGLSILDIDNIDDTDVLSDSRLPRPFGSYFSNWSNPGDLQGGVTHISNHYADLLALAVDFQVAREQQDDSISWIVTVRYSTDIGPSGPDYRLMFGGTQFGQDVTNPESPQFKPWLQLPVFEYGFAESTTARQFDLTGTPFVNSALQPLTPAPTVEIAYATLGMTRNERTFGPDVVSYWAYAVNNATFMGYPAGRVQVMPPQAKVLWLGTQKYYQVSWKFRFKPELTVKVWSPTSGAVVEEQETWQPLFLDCGFYELTNIDDGPQTLVPIYRHAARVSNQPALLNGKGRALVRPNESPVGKTPVFLKRSVYPARDFGTLFNNAMVP